MGQGPEAGLSTSRHAAFARPRSNRSQQGVKGARSRFGVEVQRWRMRCCRFRSRGGFLKAPSPPSIPSNASLSIQCNLIGRLLQTCGGIPRSASFFFFRLALPSPPVFPPSSSNLSPLFPSSSPPRLFLTSKPSYLQNGVHEGRGGGADGGGAHHRAYLEGIAN